MKWAYYNDSDEQKCAWIRELIKAGVVTDGDVDSRPIQSVSADDLRGYRRIHMFAGIAAWDYALNLAEWGEREIWTGSCPCPSFSAAGKGAGFTDPRHLWPEWYRLIRECRPGVVIGEQVDAAIGHGWLDLVCGDMEAEGYAIAPAVLGAHSAGAPHIRQRLFFCAVADSLQEYSSTERGFHAEPSSGFALSGSHAKRGTTERLGFDMGTLEQRSLHNGACQRDQPIGSGLEGHFGDVREWRGPGWLDPLTARSVAEAGATRGFWADCDWWYGRDGKYRTAGPGIQPLAHGAAARVVRLRGYGDAIVAPVAAEFIAAVMETIREQMAVTEGEPK